MEMCIGMFEGRLSINGLTGGTKQSTHSLNAINSLFPAVKGQRLPPYDNRINTVFTAVKLTIPGTRRK
jgi:hypothetical protein